jgi:hypothetical protein
MAVTYDALLRVNAKATGAGEIKNLGNAIGGLTKSAAGLGAIAGSFTGLGVALSGLGLAAAGQEIINTADSLDELSQRTGTSVETLSKLGLAARQSGLDTEQVSGSMVKLSRSLGEIATGGGEKAAAALSALGISARDAQGQLKTADQVLLEVANRFQAMPDGATKAKLAMDLFGKSGAALIPMLNMGSNAIERLNTGMSAEFAKNAGIYNDQLELLRARATALGASVLSALLPSLIKVTAFTGEMIDRIASWFSNNKERILAFGKELIDTGKKILGIGTPLAIGVAAFKLFTSTVQTAQAALKGFILLQSMTPSGLIMATAGAALGMALVGKATVEIKKISDAVPKLSQGLEGSGMYAREINDALTAAGFSTDDLTDKTNTLTDANKQQKAAAEALRKTEEDRTYWLERAGSAYQKQAAQINLISAANQRRIALAGEENTLAQAYNNLGKTILQNRLELAKTDEEKLAISKQIAQIESESARLQLEATKLQIQAEQELKAAALNRAISNRKEIESTMALAAAMYNAGQIGMDKIMDYRQELDKAKRAADTAQLEFNQAQRISNVKTQAANINYQASVLQATGEVPAIANPGMPAAMGNQTPRSYTTIAGIRIPEYAKGGYVTRPTLAVIGEGGEPEYVVPKSKAKAFANNIASGKTGDQALKPSWREIALETLANSPGDYMRASSAIMTGWRKQGGLQTAATEPILRKRAIESLGFTVGPGAHWGGGDFTIKRRPSLGAIRGELEDLRARRSGGTPPGQASITLNTRVDRVIRQDGEDRVTLAQAQTLASEAARQAVAQMDGNLKSPTYRQKLGIR